MYKRTPAILQNFYFLKLLLILQNMPTLTCLKWTIKTLEQNVMYVQSDTETTLSKSSLSKSSLVFIVNFVLVSLSLTFNMRLPAELWNLLHKYTLRNTEKQVDGKTKQDRPLKPFWNFQIR